MELLPLIYNGKRWPAAQLVGREKVFPPRPDSDATAAIVATTGHGRSWAAREPRGTWRTFAGLNRDEDEAVVDFTRRYGDIKGELAPGHSIDTSGWKSLASVLAQISTAWSEPDRDGISYVVQPDKIIEGGSLSIQEAADFLIRHVDVRLVFDANLRPEARCARLDDYMIASAAFMLARATSMKKCVHCQHWFGLKRRTGRFCSTECRSAVFRLEREEARHGIPA